VRTGKAAVLPRYPDEFPKLPTGPVAKSATWPAATGIPGQVRAAARLMYVGALFSAISWLYRGFSQSPSTAPQLLHGHGINRHSPAYAVGYHFGLILGAAVIAGLWLWMAWAVKRGRKWARVVSAVLFGLSTLELLGELAVIPASVATISWGLSWLAGLSAVILFFQRRSREFFSWRGTQMYLPGYPAGQLYGQPPEPPRDQAP
jgi:hypothetical protein